MFASILVPVDLTEKTVNAVEAARTLAAQFGARATLLHVIEAIDLPFDELEEFYGRLESKAAAALAELSKALEGDGVEVTTHVAYGSRAREIVRHAEENEVDLIVLSSRRIDPENPAAGWATVSHQVAILARCPVLLVR